MTNKQQLSLFEQTESEKKDTKWCLMLKIADGENPICFTGSIDYIYSELEKIIVVHPDFMFAAIYNPLGKLHRTYGKQPKAGL